MACLCLWCLLCFPIRKLPEQLSAASPPSSPCTKQFHWRFLVFIFLVVMQHWILPLTLHVGLWWVVTEVQLSFCIVWFGVLLTDLFTCLFCLDKACNLHNSSAPPPPSRRPTAFKVCPDYDLLPPVEGEFFCILLLFSALFFISLSIVFTFEQVRRLDSTTFIPNSLQMWPSYDSRCHLRWALIRKKPIDNPLTTRTLRNTHTSFQIKVKQEAVIEALIFSFFFFLTLVNWPVCVQSHH